jgi:UDP-N-acetylmuramate dehydrogenase
MNIRKNFSLKQLNTFGIEARAAFFVEVASEEELRQVLLHEEYTSLPRLILGGGSNLLFTKDFDGLVIKINLQGITVIEEGEHSMLIKAGAGVVWHEFVLYTIEKGLAGVENMSLIPGTVGAAPMQNIGAYGAEIKDVFESLEAMSVKDGTIRTFDGPACNFGYRESVFKKEAKNQYIITSVTFRLQKTPVYNTSYGAIQDTLAQMGVKELSLKAVSDAVVQIRKSKLPDPAEIGNAGSFFKNPEISSEHYYKLKTQYPEMPGYAVASGNVKVPAGWLIEKCGWKGKRTGEVGVHTNQALVLVNYGNGKGNDIVALSEQIQAAVKQSFNIELSPEVNFI